ncbi:MAG: NAD(P)-dependent oxidoreductase [Caldilineaceae bacterium]|nr:NAD(P)-dependent oxidoreductase [Caldilineaceae bacterium]
MTPKEQTIAILSPGDMGHAVGQVLVEHGLAVITSLHGRSERTRALAARAGLRDVGTLDEVVHAADIILSILVPDQAVATAQVVAQALAANNAEVLYVDCNAIAPQTAHTIGRIIHGAGSRYVDAGIIGPPPRQPGTTRFYASGPAVATFAALNQWGLTIIPLGNEIGQASALKMCYAALTKGMTALATELLTAAEVFDITPALAQEFSQSQALFYQQLQQALPSMPAKAHRWIGEMEEIAKTFAAIGLTPQILAGAADLYRFVQQTPLGQLTPEDPKPTVPAMITTLARFAQTEPKPTQTE